ncbi:MAG: single-stranded DNA-binding protein [Candidatus Melainabacteria bacterium]|nr:single-stranded DNA-binding protein [Candidatus Melainabacteria bacterium]
MSLSKVVVTGRVVRVPEKRFTPNGNVAVTEFSIAVDSAPRPDGTTETNTIKVITWRDLAERLVQQIAKGDLVAVDGRLQINSYTTTDGQRRREAEIEASAVENLSVAIGLGSPVPQQQDIDRPVAKVAQSAGSKKGSAASQVEDLDSIFASDDEIPF